MADGSMHGWGTCMAGGIHALRGGVRGPPYVFTMFVDFTKLGVRLI